MGTILGGAAYSIAPDHLGAPYRIVNSSNTLVWLWDHDPFGNGAPTAAAGFSHRLRFPGQVYDAESGLHSNGHRDYDPRLGRYVESDPIGLAGGINTYAYAGNDPVNAIDPLGLDPESKEDDSEALPLIEVAAYKSKNKRRHRGEGFREFGKWLRGLWEREPPSPALEGNPYHPNSVDARVRPPYRANPPHDKKSPLYNPNKTPEPADAATVYENAARTDMGVWYGKGEGGWYRYFSDNAGGAHFSGIIPEADVPTVILRGR